MKPLALALAAVVGLTCVPPAAAQPAPRVARIGFVAAVPPDFTPARPYFEAFVRRLREHGWIEKKNVVIDRRHLIGADRSAAEIVAELLRLTPDVLVVATTEAALAAKRASATIPIVAVNPADPVGTGLVASLARPGGNVTGMSFIGTELAGKQLELLREAIPGLARVAVFANPANASHPARIEEAEAVARALKLQLDVLQVGTPQQLDAGFGVAVRRRAQAVLVLIDPLLGRHQRRIAELAVEAKLPALYGLREFVEAGGLMAYGPDFVAMYRRAADYTDKILRGAKPADLPVEQVSRFELVINAKTAEALGITIPPSLAVRADHIIR